MKNIHVFIICVILLVLASVSGYYLKTCDTSVLQSEVKPVVASLKKSIETFEHTNDPQAPQTQVTQVIQKEKIKSIMVQNLENTTNLTEQLKLVNQEYVTTEGEYIYAPFYILKNWIDSILDTDVFNYGSGINFLQDDPAAYGRYWTRDQYETIIEKWNLMDGVRPLEDLVLANDGSDPEYHPSASPVVFSQEAEAYMQTQLHKREIREKFLKTYKSLKKRIKTKEAYKNVKTRKSLKERFNESFAETEQNPPMPTPLAEFLDSKLNLGLSDFQRSPSTGNFTFVPMHVLEQNKEAIEEVMTTYADEIEQIRLLFNEPFTRKERFLPDEGIDYMYITQTLAERIDAVFGTDFSHTTQRDGRIPIPQGFMEANKEALAELIQN